MSEIKCPRCGNVFQINEQEYEHFIQQIKNEEFEKELSIREKQFKLDKENSIKLQSVEFEKKLLDIENKYKLEINDLKNELQNTEKDTKSKLEKQYNEIIKDKELLISNLKNDLKIKDTEKELALKNISLEKEHEIDILNNKIKLKENEYIVKEQSIKSAYEEKIKNKDEQIAYYKDFKARQSTKMVGESLEVHCNNEFNRLRPLFKNVYFEKDNDVKTGSKGDFIFREYDDNNLEILSIMFEMKNESETTQSKHKNEDFFKELDKDRKEKNCEYAVLVSLLEIDNDYYNNGIVDISHKYDKMYVIRPQFFIPIITILRNAALKSIKYKQELELIRNQNIDISHFEENMNNFKENFGRNYRIASDKFKKAIEEIDKTIEHLNKTKEALLSSENNLRIANNKVEDLSIKKITNNSPTMREMFDKLNEEQIIN